MKKRPDSLVNEWLEKARNDLAYAKASFEEFDNFYAQMCILCHDAVEKFLKAFLIASGKRLSRTHDVVALVRGCGNVDSAFLEYVDECKVVNRYYVPLKYPSHYPQMRREQAAEAIHVAEQIQAVVSERIEGALNLKNA